MARYQRGGLHISNEKLKTPDSRSDRGVYPVSPCAFSFYVILDTLHSLPLL